MADSYLKHYFNLEGKRAVVTGAGRGIGRAVAEGLAAAGAQVLVHYNKSREAAVEVAASIESRGGKAWTAGADLTDPKATNDLFALIADKWGALDILVNNAGDLIKRTRVADASNELIDKVMKLNILGTVLPTRAAISLLEMGQDPCIVNVSSVAAHNGGANGAVIYASAKGAILTFTRGLAKELAPGIRVNGIAPGVVYTDFHKTHSTPEGLETIVGNTPLRRLGNADDMSAAVIFLCGSGASFITGEIIEINGGLWVA